jgi:uncharacterized membrane protein
MGNLLPAKTGQYLYAIALLAIGVIHLATGHFPAGLLPVPATLPGKTILTYINGIAMILAALWILLKPQGHQGPLAAALLWLLLLALVHLPLLLPHLDNGGEWAAALEIIAFLSGALVMTGMNKPGTGSTYIKTGQYLFAATLIGFGILHYIYNDYIITLIPAWLPAKTFLSWLVLIAFFAAAFSLILGKLVKLAMYLLSAMFFIWVIILHLPRALDKQAEPECTSLFVALAMSGMALIMYAAGKASK